VSGRSSTPGPTGLIEKGYYLRGWRVVGCTSFPQHGVVCTVAIAQRFVCRFAPAAFSKGCTTGRVTPTPARVAWRAVLDDANAYGRFAGHLRVRQAERRVIRLLTVTNYGRGEMPAGGSGAWGTGRPLRRERRTPRQQLGRAMDRDWAGGTGRAGWSDAGKRLGNFFIGRLLIASNCHHKSRQTSSRAESSRPHGKVKNDVLEEDIGNSHVPLIFCVCICPQGRGQTSPKDGAQSVHTTRR
jgi:hypothetical protein